MMMMKVSGVFDKPNFLEQYIVCTGNPNTMSAVKINVLLFT